MKVLHFGAGNIGRGFIAPILLKDPCLEHLKFVDLNQKIIDQINQLKQFNVIELGAIKNVVNITGQISGVVNTKLAVALEDYAVEFCTTSIGATNLKHIVNDVIKIIQKNEQNNKTLIIMACENGEKVSSMFKKEIQNVYHFNEKLIHFVDVMVDRIVPDQTVSGIDVEVEAYYSWVVDQKQWPANIPKITTLTYSNDIDAEISKKVWLLNGGHASLCWASYQNNQFHPPFTNASLQIPELKTFLLNYLKEVGLIFAKHFNYNFDEIEKFINQIITRFENPYINDYLERVGRNLIAKLQLNERILKPLFIGRNLGLPTLNLKATINHALDYTNPNDADGAKIAQMHIEQKNKVTILQEIVANITEEQIKFILNLL
ncbi:hypothetical protein [Williamsoniiplasma lucivorax]|uniref:Mannitol-1-phosphate 5-dehydrogenase n=1 Tax=Williamsoniiplasma lucivorax TaxID=209274 RepID=A0A2S5RCX3_9MOLU|nr:hypothetical protein [Williamsoniiplasma lucivorax]PPE05160.1 mannitol-1-phosphate 5-dehydrogenase [Williamsoniiplasma lucivorax]